MNIFSRIIIEGRTLNPDNRDYRRLNRVDMMTAGQDLRDMVQTGLVDQTGFGGWTKFAL